MKGVSNDAGRKVVGFLREWGMILLILVITAVATMIRPVFLSGRNILNILRSYSTIGIASIGMAYTIIGGGMDLSIGSTISLSAVVTMLIINATSNVAERVCSPYAAVLVLFVGIAIGAAVGLVNGAIIAVVNGRMGESFIITFAMQIVVGAMAQAVVKGQFQAAAYKSGLFKEFGVGVVPVIFFLVVAAIMQLILTRTQFGRNLYFLGANMKAAKMAGIRVGQVRTISHVLCGMCAGLAGVLVVSRVNSASVLQGQGYELDAMACVAIGGVSLAGGDGSILKTILGVLVLGFLLTALNILSVQSNAQLFVRGVVIIAAVILDTVNKKAKLREVRK